ncbi:MAG TPA: DUF1801 domain-containing protein [Anditalea sp.]|nr:DUF1801 domain-containing protein [Anditalea sp.]
MYNTQVTEYIEKAPGVHSEIMEKIRSLIHDTVPNLQEEFKWNRPVFKSHKDFAYLKVAKSYVTLGFNNYKLLEDKNNRLEGTGEDMRHVKLKSMDDIDSELFSEWFKTVSQ